ncbi:hypothetical protein J3E69DRAFT_360590 [Trichoderma sp. SZMC 28015]
MAESQAWDLQGYFGKPSHGKQYESRCEALTDISEMLAFAAKCAAILNPSHQTPRTDVGEYLTSDAYEILADEITATLRGSFATFYLLSFPWQENKEYNIGYRQLKAVDDKFFFSGVLNALPDSKLCPLQKFTERCREVIENGVCDCNGSWTDTVLSYTFLVNAVLTSNVAGGSDNPVYVHRPITYAVFVKVEISHLSAHSDKHEQTFHVRATSWVAKAELNYDFYEKQREQLSKLKESLEAILSKEGQMILPEIETFWYTSTSS